jgi:hypothetical protein
VSENYKKIFGHNENISVTIRVCEAKAAIKCCYSVTELCRGRDAQLSPLAALLRVRRVARDKTARPPRRTRTKRAKTRPEPKNEEKRYRKQNRYTSIFLLANILKPSSGSNFLAW